MNAEMQRAMRNCSKHGEFETRNVLGTIWTKCPTCANEDAERAKLERESSERAALIAAWEKRLGNAGIPDRFQDRTLESYRADNDGQRKALDFAVGYVEHFSESAESGRGAVMIGRPGTGKTHLAIGIGIAVMRSGYSVAFSTVMRAIRRIRNTWGRNSDESEDHAIEAFTQPDLLILDEVGVQVGSDNEKLLIFDMLNERYEARRPTLLLSNLSLDDVKAYLGERVFDRMREDGGAVVVFDWDSYRVELAKQARGRE